MRAARARLPLTAVALLAALAGPAEAWSGSRGVGLHTLMNWGTLEPGKTEAYASPPFGPPEHEISDALLGNLRAAGFDFLRLTVDPGPFLQFEGERRDRLDAILLANVKRLRRHGFSVVVDFHPNGQVERLGRIALLKEETGPLFETFLGVLGRTARLLAGLEDDEVALEALNEPPYGYNPKEIARWQRMLARIHGTIRRAAPDLEIVLSGARGGGIRGLTEIDPRPFDDGRTLFSFHYYEPHIFTHQSVKSSTPSMRMLRYYVNVPYPAASGSAEAVRRGIRTEIEADPTLPPAARQETEALADQELDAYVRSGFGPADIAADFDRVSDWARRYGVAADRIFLGEFGVVRTFGRYHAADPVSYAAWLRDVRRAAEERGFAWSVWSVKSYGGMAVIEAEGSNLLHGGTLRALGLQAP